MTLDFVGESKPRKDASAQEQETVSLSGLRRAPFYSIAAEHYRLTGRKDRRYATEQDDYP